VPATPRLARVASAICLALQLASCGGDGGPSAPPEAGIRAILGAGITDTVDAQPLQALVVEVRGSGGVLASGVLVRFQAVPSADTARRLETPVFLCDISDPFCGDFVLGHVVITEPTDAQGRAKITVRLGTIAGPAIVRLTVPDLGLADSVTYTVTPGAAAGVIPQSRDTSLDIGSTATLRGGVFDRHHNARPEQTTITAGPGGAITLDAGTGIVTGRDMGTQSVFFRYNSFVDSTNVHVTPAGRLVVWSSLERVVRLVNLNGSNERLLLTNVDSDLGSFPRFDPTRQRVTLHDAIFGGPPNNIIVVDTTGSPRRDISAATPGFTMVIATRQLADGTVLVVGQAFEVPSHPGYSLWSVATDNTITFLAALPDLGSTDGGADISHNGSRVAYVANIGGSATELRVLDVSSGSSTVLEPNTASAPSWSAQDDRVAYLVSGAVGSAPPYGALVIINTDGTGRSALGSTILSPGLAWSPDGKYIVGRPSSGGTLRVLRLSDGANVVLKFSGGTGCCHDYWQPDWR
jgi:hypothetical protein